MSLHYYEMEPATSLSREDAESNGFPGRPPLRHSFDKPGLRHLLKDQEAVGVRIHIISYSNPPAAIAVPVRSDGSEIFDSSSRSYLKNDFGNLSDPIQRSEFEAYLPQSDEQKAQYYCAFFSRMVINDILGQAGNDIEAGVHILPGTYTYPMRGNQYPTLIAVASNGRDIPSNSTFFRSELPCPPHCGGGTDYGSGHS